jgi:hypothetical protein
MQAPLLVGLFFKLIFQVARISAAHSSSAAIGLPLQFRQLGEVRGHERRSSAAGRRFLRLPNIPNEFFQPWVRECSPRLAKAKAAVASKRCLSGDLQ